MKTFKNSRIRNLEARANAIEEFVMGTLSAVFHFGMLVLFIWGVAKFIQIIS